MPAFPGWYILVPQILESLSQPTAPPFLDRSSIERVFQVRRRQAIRLMQQWGGYQVGKTFLVDRKAVVQSLTGLLKSGCIDQVLQRKRRVFEAISEAENSAAARRAKIRRRYRVCEYVPGLRGSFRRTQENAREPADRLFRQRHLVEERKTR